VNDRTLTVQGTEVPKLGLGTWQVTGRDAVDGVRDALAMGYRHVDTARMYENETEVGEGIRSAGVERSEIFLTTKVWTADFAADRLIARPRTRCASSAPTTSTCCSCTGPTPSSTSPSRSARWPSCASAG
jgi:diketogulonate reductase-like aldo/keto reductase